MDNVLEGDNYGKRVSKSKGDSPRSLETIVSFEEDPCAYNSLSVVDIDEVSESTPLKKKDSRTNKRQNSQLTQNEILIGNLNYYFADARSWLVPEFYATRKDGLRVRTSLIDYTIQGEKNSPFDWGKDHIFFKTMDEKIFPEGLIPWSKKILPDGEGERPQSPVALKWIALKTVATFILGSAFLYAYGAGSWGVNPTRLYLMGKAFPFLPIQGTVSIGLSVGMSIYDMFPNLMEGGSRFASFYKYLFVNWGIPDTHGFRTAKDDLYVLRRDLELNRTDEEKENLRDYAMIREQSHMIRAEESKLAEKMSPLERNIASKRKQLLKANGNANAQLSIEIERMEFELQQMKSEGTLKLNNLKAAHEEQRRMIFNLEGLALQDKINSITAICSPIISSEQEKAVEVVDKAPHINDIDWENAYVGKMVVHGIIGFLATLQGLLYALTFYSAEIYNDQAAYGNGLVISVFFLIFGLEYHQLYSQYNHEYHANINKSDPEVHDLKTALQQILDKTENMIKKSDDFTEKMCEVDSAENVSKLSVLFMNFKSQDIVEGSNSNAVRKTIEATKSSSSKFRKFAKMIGTLSVGAWIIAEFFIFSDITEQNIVPWAGIAVGILAASSTILKEWKEQPKVYARFFDGLSWHRPLYGLNWLFFVTSLASSIWSTAFNIGILSDLLGADRALVKYPIYALCLSKIPGSLEWGRERLNDILRLTLTNRLITYFINTTTQKKIHLLGSVLPRVRQAIHEWDADTTQQFAYLVLGLKENDENENENINTNMNVKKNQ